jgi:hypothetical protein
MFRLKWKRPPFVKITTGLMEEEAARGFMHPRIVPEAEKSKLSNGFHAAFYAAASAKMGATGGNEHDQTLD